jgi:hypothetical protein
MNFSLYTFSRSLYPYPIYHSPSPSPSYVFHFRADIQRRGSKLAWIVILSVYGADTVAETKLLISPFLR